MNALERHHMDRVARLWCCVCKRATKGKTYRDARIGELHHVAEGSGQRSSFGVVKLCTPHHQGPIGIHGLGTKAFIRLYRPPGDSEYGLLVWTNEDLAEWDLIVQHTDKEPI